MKGLACVYRHAGKPLARRGSVSSSDNINTRDTHSHYFLLILSVKINITPAVQDPHLLLALGDSLQQSGVYSFHIEIR